MVAHVRYVWLHPATGRPMPARAAPPPGARPAAVLDMADGREVLLDDEQRMIRRGVGAVYLGPEYDGALRWVWRRPGAEPRAMAGYTDDPLAVAVARAFVAAVDGGAFAAGPVPLPAVPGPGRRP